MNDLVYLILLLLLLTIIFIVFFMMPRFTKRKELLPFRQWHYAHRGYHDLSKGFPENSLPAFERACTHGYGMELDVQLTKNHELIVLHDFSLLRACGVDKQVDELTLDEIRKLRLFNTDCMIPTFEEVLKLVDGRTPLIVEIKQKGAECETCRKTAKLLDKYHGLYCVESFNPIAVGWFKNHRSNYIRGQLSGELNMKQPAKFMLENLLTNFISRPDFIAYDVEHRQRRALKLCIACFKTPLVYWTVKDHQTFDELKNAIIIFEGFEAK